MSRETAITSSVIPHVTCFIVFFVIWAHIFWNSECNNPPFIITILSVYKKRELEHVLCFESHWNLNAVGIHEGPGVLKQTDVMCITRTCRLRETHWNIMAHTRLCSLTGPTYRTYYSEVHYSSVKSQKDVLSDRLCMCLYTCIYFSGLAACPLVHWVICLCVCTDGEAYLDVCWQKIQSKSFKAKQLFVPSDDLDAHQIWNNKVCTLNLLP